MNYFYNLWQRSATFGFTWVLGSAIMKIAWGIWVLNPMYDSIGLSNAYVEMNKYFTPNSDRVWGIIFVVCGVIQLHSLFTRYFLYRLITSYISLALWGFIVIQLAVVNLGSTGIATYGTMAIMEFFITGVRMWEHLRKRMYKDSIRRFL